MQEIAAITGLHRTTVKRLLETLRNFGFVRHLECGNCYQMTVIVQQLADNLTPDIVVADIARPMLRELTTQVLWPSDIATREGAEMVVRDSTHEQSKLSFAKNVFRWRASFLHSAVGRAYLAFCPEQERLEILRMISPRNEQGQKVSETRRVTRTISEVRQRGFAVNERGENGGIGRFGAIAVPVIVNGRVIACVNIVFLARAITAARIVAEHLDALNATRCKLERELEAVAAKGAKLVPCRQL